MSSLVSYQRFVSLWKYNGLSVWKNVLTLTMLTRCNWILQLITFPVQILQALEELSQILSNDSIYSIMEKRRGGLKMSRNAVLPPTLTIACLHSKTKWYKCKDLEALNHYFTKLKILYQKLVMLWVSLVSCDPQNSIMWVGQDSTLQNKISQAPRPIKATLSADLFKCWRLFWNRLLWRLRVLSFQPQK